MLAGTRRTLFAYGFALQQAKYSVKTSEEYVEMAK